MDLLKRPNYRLKVENWWEDGTKDEPEFYELTEIDGNLKLTRREFPCRNSPFICLAFRMGGEGGS
jgi:hypothetical protein